MKIYLLSKENIEEAIRLTDQVFPDDVDSDYSPSKVFHTSVEPQSNKEWFAGRKLTMLENFVAYDESNKMIGVTGLYQRQEDQDDAVWLSWYCVDPKERGKGYGKAILEWTIEEAKRRGFALMKLWTTEDPNEAIAQKLYEKLGFKITGTEKRKDQQYTVLYRERKI